MTLTDEQFKTAIEGIEAGKAIVLRIIRLEADAEEMIEKDCEDCADNMLHKAEGLREALRIIFNIEKDDFETYDYVTKTLLRLALP